MSSHILDYPGDTEAALLHLEEQVAIWGGDFRRTDADEPDADAKVVLPVQAGVRHGALLLNARALRLGDGSNTRLELVEERSDYRLPGSSLLLLLCGLTGALLIVAMPLVPRLVGLLPISVAFLILAWFLVLARVKYRGLAEFVEQVKEMGEE